MEGKPAVRASWSSRLTFVLAAAGSAVPYLGLAPLLDAEQPVYAFEAPGVTSGEPVRAYLGSRGLGAVIVERRRALQRERPGTAEREVRLRAPVVGGDRLPRLMHVRQ